MKGATVVLAGVAASAENADDAGLTLAHASGCSKHIAFYMDGGSGADDLPQRTGNDRCFLWSATSTIEVDG